jgi:hypothetical protein
MAPTDFAKPLARATDPETSKQAARRIAPQLQGLHETVERYVRESPGMTCSELSEKYRQRDPRTIGRRMAEIEAKGFIRRGEARKCTITKMQAATWWPVDQT